MKLRPGFDDELQPKRRAWCLAGPFDRPIDDRGGRLWADLGRHGGNGEAQRGTYVRLPRRFQHDPAVPQVKAPAAQPRDPFVVVAAAEIDAKMVVPAPAGIDEAMVFNPVHRQQRVVTGCSGPGESLIPLPVDPPGQVPENDVLPQAPAPAHRAEPEIECAMPDVDDAIAWDFLTLVDWWNLYGLPALLAGRRDRRA